MKITGIRNRNTDKREQRYLVFLSSQSCEKQLIPYKAIPKVNYGWKGSTPVSISTKYYNDPVTKYRSEWGNMCHSSPTKLIFGLENSAPYHKTDISLSSGLTDRFIGDF